LKKVRKKKKKKEEEIEEKIEEEEERRRKNLTEGNEEKAVADFGSIESLGKASRSSWLGE